MCITIITAARFDVVKYAFAFKLVHRKLYIPLALLHKADNSCNCKFMDVEQVSLFCLRVYLMITAKHLFLMLGAKKLLFLTVCLGSTRLINVLRPLIFYYVFLPLAYTLANIYFWKDILFLLQFV